MNDFKLCCGTLTNESTSEFENSPLKVRNVSCLKLLTGGGAVIGSGCQLIISRCWRHGGIGFEKTDFTQNLRNETTTVALKVIINFG